MEGRKKNEVVEGSAFVIYIFFGGGGLFLTRFVNILYFALLFLFLQFVWPFLGGKKMH